MPEKPTQRQTKEKRFALEQFKKEFCPLLMKRLFPVIRWNIPAQGKILPLINVIDRSTDELIIEKRLVYAGITVLPQLPMFSSLKLEGKDKHIKEAIWNLVRFEFTAGQSIETNRFFNEYEDGELGMEDVQTGTLAAYFEQYLRIRKFAKPEQEHEYPIIKRFFDIKKDRVISLPLIQFGTFDGLVHLIFEESDQKHFEDTELQKRLIRLFSMEYEGMLLDWDLVGDNIERKSELPRQLEYLTSEEYEAAASTNKIFRELNYRQYYEDSRAYFEDRIRHSDNVPEYLKNEHRKRAIISILIDSYAHNISAHSLTVLKWWFQQRANTREALKDVMTEIAKDLSYPEWSTSLRKYLESRLDGYEPEDIEGAILHDVARWVNIADRNEGVYLPVRDQFMPLADQLHPLFRFLLEKGAFWSGITRDQQFGGEITNLYEILWEDFINNPLYLGTIAYSEGITKLNINIRIYSERKYTPDKPDIFKRTYEVATDPASGKPLSGRFATISVGGEKVKSFTHNYLKYGPEEHEAHERIAAYLKENEVFFPGGVVGKHAFFTLIENEIRNVKHYPEDVLQQMRKNGLDLFIGIRPSLLSTGKKIVNPENEKPLLKIGIWLGQPTELYQSGQHLVTRRFDLLMKDIITEKTNRARLGGNFQDKICAAMLFNNTFLSVEEQNTQRDKNYYPWLRIVYSAGLEANGITEIDYEVRKKNLNDARRDFENRKEHAAQGLFKKYFYIWRGQPLYQLQAIEDLQVENLNRFKIVTVKQEDLKEKVRSEGVLRVIKHDDKVINSEHGYHRWLEAWLKKSPCMIAFFQGSTPVGYLVFDQRHVQYYPQDEFMYELSAADRQQFTSYSTFKLEFAHGDKDKSLLSIRSHGILRQFFFDNLESINDFDEAILPVNRAYELLEVIQTRICIFDKRIAERIDDPTKRNFLQEKLKCGIYGEIPEEWETVRDSGLNQYHFIIMHLSFIEALQNEQGYRYGEEGIVDFLDEQVGQHLSENCVFVVTTGRGREEWWRKIEASDYRAFTTFRPVEMLIEAVETARLKEDDINLKYNLIKVLFGS
ncbi:MAG: hypothetical protein AAFO03_19660 [Bacteroidota bacterium]